MPVRIACFLIVPLFTLAAGPYAFAAAPKDLADLQGTWKVVSLEVAGKAQDLTRQPRWVIKGDKVLYAGEELALLTVDRSTTPRSIDLAFRKPKRVYEGVFAVDRDTLKICVNSQTEGVKERPLKLATANQPTCRLLVFKRVQARDDDAAEGLSGFVGIAIRIDWKKRQVIIQDVLDASPAKKAGLKKEDILLRIGGGGVSDLPGTVRTIQQAKPGSQLILRIQRGGKEKDITVKVGTLPFMLLD